MAMYEDNRKLSMRNVHIVKLRLTGLYDKVL